MTQQLKHNEQFRFRKVEMRYRADGSESYSITAFPQYGQGWSKYPRDMFIHGDQGAAKALYEQLAAVPEGVVLRLSVVSGNVRQGKLDDGKPDSYYWNVVGFADDATPTPEPQSKPQLHSEPVEPTQSKAKDALAAWDPRDTQARISWAQAINLAVAALGPPGATVFDASTLRLELATGTVERLANEFYPLILRGPGYQQPEEAQDADETPQDDVDHGQGEDDAALTPPVPPQGHAGAGAKPWHEQFFEAARAKGMKPTEALKLLGVGNWNKWVEAKHTLQEALERLAG